MAKIKPVKVNLGDDFNTPIREKCNYKLAEVLLNRLDKASSNEGFSFGKYLRNMASNMPFPRDGIDIFVPNETVKEDILAMMDPYYEIMFVDHIENSDKNSFDIYDIENPSTKTKIRAKFWKGSNVVDKNIDVNSLVRKESIIESSSGKNLGEIISSIKKGGAEIDLNIVDGKELEDLTRWQKQVKYVLGLSEKFDNLDTEEKTIIEDLRKEQTKMDKISLNSVKTHMVSDAKEATIRMAATQSVKAVKAGLLALLKEKGNMDDSKLGTLRELLDTEFGTAIISLLIGYIMTYVPQLQNDARFIKLADEFRISAMSTAGNAVIETAMQYFLPTITGVFNTVQLPAVEARAEDEVMEEELETIEEESQLQA